MLKSDKNQCRGCRNSSRNSESIHGKKSLDKEVVELSKMYEILTGITINEDEEEIFPKVLCLSCINNLLLLMKFRGKCIESDRYFRNLKPKIEEVIVESIAVTAAIVVPDFDEALVIKEELETNDELQKNDINQEPPSEEPDEEDEFQTDDDDDYVPFDGEVTNGNTSGNSSDDECLATIKTKVMQEKLNNSQTVKKRRVSSINICHVCNKNFTLPCHLRVHLQNAHQPKKHECEICFKKFTLLSILKRHTETHNKPEDDDPDRKHPCAYCGKKFYTRHTLTRHADTQHKIEGPVQCELCNAKFRSVQHYEIHKEIDHKTDDIKAEQLEEPKLENDDKSDDDGDDDDDDVWAIDETPDTNLRNQCPICKKLFNKPYRLKIHMRLHNPEDQLPCNICGKRFIRQQVLKQHIESHAKENLVDCDVCGIYLGSRRRVAFHKRKFHRKRTSQTKVMEDGGNEKMEDLPIENIVKHEEERIEETIKLKENKKKPKKKYVASQKLKEESDTADSVEKKRYNYKRNFCCDICGKSYFTTKATFNEHVIAHNGPNYKCHICEKPYRSRCSMREHILTHTGQKRHLCRFCGYQSFTAVSLKNHIRTVHTKESPFKCNLCDFAGPTSSSVLFHRKREHENKFKYPCTICDETFHAPRLLKSHMYTHNPDNICPVCNKKCTDRKRYRIHVQSHSKDFPCKICGQQFSFRSRLKRHLKTHAKHLQVPVEELIANDKANRLNGNILHAQ